MLRASARALALVLLGATVPACGGSGGGGGVQPPVVVVLGDQTMQGTYFAVLKAGRATGGVEGAASTGPFSASGAGLASHTQITNRDGTITGPSTTPYEYDVGPNGNLELRVIGLPIARGGISADGECALAASISPGAFPGVFVLRRRSGFHTPASLSGPYHFVLMQTGALGIATSTLTGSATFDGAGGLDLAVTVNSMGTISPPLALPLTYTVTGDGTSVFAPGTTNLEGGVAADGGMAVWAGSTVGLDASPAIAVALRQATSAGLATFQGEYWIVCVSRDPASGNFRSFHGTATADGAGVMTFLSEANTEGTITTEPPQSTPYGVAASGKFTVDAGGNLLQGGISQDGKYAVLGGGTVAGSDPTICVLCRK